MPELKPGNHFPGDIAKQDKRYTVRDIAKQDKRYTVRDHVGADLTVSQTVLIAGECTNGHSHKHEEVYHFISGAGQLQIDVKMMDVKPGDIWLIPRGVFHKVCAKDDMTFICVFQGKR